MELILHSVIESSYLQHFYFIIETMLERIAYQNASVVTTVQSIVTVQTVLSMTHTRAHILNKSYLQNDIIVCTLIILHNTFNFFLVAIYEVLFRPTLACGLVSF